MKSYDINDPATFYFIIVKRNSTNEIKAWTDNKAYAQFYLKFHNCKQYHMRVVDKRYRDILPIINENVNDEIEIMNVITKCDNKIGSSKIVQVPMTGLEMSIVRDAENTFCSTIVDYAMINKYMHLMKSKYQKAFNDIGLTSIIKSDIYGKSSKFTENLSIDELRILARLFIGDFN